MNTLKAFVVALKEHLQQKKPDYIYTEALCDSSGGSDWNCQVDGWDTEAMFHEIDVFAEKFNNVGGTTL